MCECTINTENPPRLTEDFLSLFCEKNSDGTKNLRLKGNELQYRIKRRIHNKDMVLISSFLNSHPEIIALDMPYNNLGNEGLVLLTKNYLMMEKNNLMDLILVGCDITVKGLETLCNSWLTLRLKTLRLTGNKIGPESGPILERLLVKVPSLELLDLADTGQTVNSIPYVCSALRSDVGGNNTLKVLDISNVIPTSAFYQCAPSVMAECVGETIRTNNSLMELHMQKCNMDGHDVELLLLGLTQNNTLLMLDIAYNRISNFGADVLAKWLRTSPALMGLNIAGCDIGEHGGRALSFGVPFSNLRLLDISQNKITDKGMSEFLKSIKKQHPMRNLFIFGNELGPLSLPILERQVMGDVYVQEQVDFKLFRTPEGLHVSKYPANVYKNHFYCQLQHADVQELKIRRNVIESDYCAAKAKVKPSYYEEIHGDPECMKDSRYTPRRGEEKLRARCAEQMKRLLEEQQEQKMAEILQQFDQKEDSSSGSSIQESLAEESDEAFCPDIYDPNMNLMFQN